MVPKAIPAPNAVSCVTLSLGHGLSRCDPLYPQPHHSAARPKRICGGNKCGRFTGPITPGRAGDFGGIPLLPGVPATHCTTDWWPSCHQLTPNS